MGERDNNAIIKNREMRTMRKRGRGGGGGDGGVRVGLNASINLVHSTSLLSVPKTRGGNTQILQPTESKHTHTHAHGMVMFSV